MGVEVSAPVFLCVCVGGGGGFFISLPCKETLTLLNSKRS